MKPCCFSRALFFLSLCFLFLVSAYCNGRHWENSTKIISTGLAGVPGRDAYWMGEYTQVIHPISNSTGRSWVNNAVCYKVLLTGRTENLSNQRKQIMSFRQPGFRGLDSVQWLHRMKKYLYSSARFIFPLATRNIKMFWINLRMTLLPPDAHTQKRVLFWVSVGSLRFQRATSFARPKGPPQSTSLI